MSECPQPCMCPSCYDDRPPMTTDTERLIAEAEAVVGSSEAREIVHALIAALRTMQAEKRELALDVLAASGQAQEAYEAQLAAEAKLAAVEKERDAAREAVEAIAATDPYLILATEAQLAAIREGRG